MQIPLLISSGWKMICFNIVPVVRRKQNTTKFTHNGQERGFLQGSMWKVTQEADYIPASYYHWRYSTNRPILKLLQIVSTQRDYCLDSLRLLAQVNHEYWREEDKNQGLSFHHLKMLLLWATRFFSSPEDWVNLEGSVYRLLVILLCCLVTNNLPHFLYPEQNLFQGEGEHLSSLYPKVETFANNPAYFLKFHFTATRHKTPHQMDSGLKALLHLPAEDKAYWDTAFFDVLLSKFQMYEITDAQRVSAMSSILTKTKKMVTNWS